MDDRPLFAAIAAIVYRGAWGITGQLTVWRDRLTFTCGTSRRLALGWGMLSTQEAPPQEITQTGDFVTLYRPRIGIPWMMLGVALVADGHRYVAVLPAWEHRRVRGALDRAGFKVEERRTWASVGSYDT